jgi:hypothetical protein
MQNDISLWQNDVRLWQNDIALQMMAFIFGKYLLYNDLHLRQTVFHCAKQLYILHFSPSAKQLPGRVI